MRPTERSSAPASRLRLERVLCVGRGHAFYGPSGSFASQMSHAILKLKVRRGGFPDALSALMAVRRKIMDLDARAAFTGGRAVDFARVQAALRQAEIFDRDAPKRLAGRSRSNFDTTIEPWSPFQKYFKATPPPRRRLWTPEGPCHGLRHPPLVIQRLPNGRIRIRHSSSGDIPKVLSHLGNLWDRALAAADSREALRLIAEFEWWFFAANPAGRCGASLGNALALALSLKCGLPPRRRFYHLDFHAFKREPRAYVKWRMRIG
ncbi:MAG TPA: hypothetical protein VFV50_08030 [Bdellovibrionales bacterium]|nr:hypothetical protein [Bdellovibrionales bacterium]